MIPLLNYISPPAFCRWTSRQEALDTASARPPSAPSDLLSGLICASLDAEYEAALPIPIRNAEVPVPPTAAAGSAAISAAVATVSLLDVAPGQVG